MVDNIKRKCQIIKDTNTHLGEQQASAAPAVKSPYAGMNTLQLLTA